jgi:hypothetical protein
MAFGWLLKATEGASNGCQWVVEADERGDIACKLRPYNAFP